MWRLPARLLWLASAIGFYGEALAGQAPALLRQFYGELALEVRDAGDGAVRLGAADAERSVAILLLKRDLARWADSASRLLAARSGLGRSRVLAEEPGTGGGSLSLTRTASGEKVVWTLFIADGDFVSVQTVLSQEDARKLVAALKRVTTGAGPRRRDGRLGSETSALRSRPQLLLEEVSHAQGLSVGRIEKQSGLNLAQRLGQLPPFQEESGAEEPRKGKAGIECCSALEAGQCAVRLTQPDPQGAQVEMRQRLVGIDFEGAAISLDGCANIPSAGTSDPQVYPSQRLQRVQRQRVLVGGGCGGQVSTFRFSQAQVD